MTKTLTEQWREGTLNGGIYYLLLRDGTKVTDKTVYIVGEKQLRWHYSSFDFVKEVLATVPDYDEVKQMSQKVGRLEFDNEVLDNELKELATKNDTLAVENGRLQEKLAIATKALKDIKVRSQRDWDEYNCMECVDKALKEMEGVK